MYTWYTLKYSRHYFEPKNMHVPTAELKIMKIKKCSDAFLTYTVFIDVLFFSLTINSAMHSYTINKLNKVHFFKIIFL